MNKIRHEAYREWKRSNRWCERTWNGHDLVAAGLQITNAHFCRECRESLRGVVVSEETQILGGQPETVYHQPHHSNYTDLSEAARLGCKICQAFLQVISGLSEVWLRTYSSDVSLTTFSGNSSNNRRMYTVGIAFSKTALRYLKENRAGNPGELPLKYTVERTIGVEFPFQQIARSASTGSSECFTQIQCWIAGCQEYHPTCPRIENAWHPNRLLDLHTSDQGFIRLIDSSASRPSGGYVALSHCWGSSKPMQLTQATLAKLNSGIDIAALPPTFRDAIVACHKLSINYLWIDSLCIIQDSEEDWSKEAVLMKDIYRNAFCTITAAASGDSQEGLFRTRAMGFSDAWQVDLNGSWGQEESFTIVREQWINFKLDQMPTSRRGWIFQERIMSPRVVYFAADQIFWECAVVASESFPDGYYWEAQSKQTRLKSLGLSLKEKDNKRIHRMWQELASDYMKCQLTKDEDRLVAMMGISEAVKHDSRDICIAGIWGRSLPEQLVWRVVAHRQANGQPSRRASPARAPSWSWASLEAEIDYPDISEWKPIAGLACVEHDDCQPVEKQKSVKATVTLSGYLVRGRTGFDNVIQESTIELTDNEGKAQPALFYPDVSRGVFSEDIFCLGIMEKLDLDAQDQSTLFPSPFRIQTHGLVLVPSPSGRQGQYQRIGYFLAVDATAMVMYESRRPPLKKEDRKLYLAWALGPSQYLEII